jgi:hypothetical protein
MFINFEQYNSGLQRYGALSDLHDEIRSGRPPLDDLDAKIWRFWITLFLNQRIQ